MSIKIYPELLSRYYICNIFFILVEIMFLIFKITQ